jgi:hypothetical protein
MSDIGWAKPGEVGEGSHNAWGDTLVGFFAGGKG